MVQSVFRQAVQDVTGVVRDTGPSADSGGMAAAWLPSVRSLLQSSPDLSSVSGHGSERTRQLLQVAQRFQQMLHENQWFDLSEVYWQALKQLPVSQTVQTVLIYGYIQPRSDELSWINAIAADNSVVLIPAPNTPLFTDVQIAIEWLVQHDWEKMSDRLEDNHEPVIGDHLSRAFIGYRHPVLDQHSGVKSYSYSTLEAEIRGTLANVKTLLNAGIPAQAIAIIAREEEAYGPKLLDIAWEYGVPLRALYDTPLLSTRLGAWLSLLIEVIDTRWPFESTAKLLSHPLCSDPEKEFWATVRVQHPVGFSQWQAIASQHLGLDLSGLSNLNRKRSLKDWAKWWDAIFQGFKLRKRCARWARESIAFNNLREALGELAQWDSRAIDWSEFRPMFRDLLQTLTVLAQPGRGGVELHKPSSVVGGRYTHLFVMGMAEGLLPAAIRNDPVLDFFERQQLQQSGLVLPAAAALARCEALFFFSLLQTVTESVTFSYAERAGRQEHLLSPYLKQLGLQPTTPPTPAIASPEEWRKGILRHLEISKDEIPEDDVLSHMHHAFTVEQHRESHAFPDEYDGILEVPFDYSDWTFSVSQLSRLGQCPFKWFADKLLRLGVAVEIEEEVSPSQIGQLYHKVLDLILTEKQQAPDLDITNTALLDEKFEIAERDIIPANLTSWPLRRSEHLRCLSLAIADPQFLPKGAEPLQLEATFKGEWHGLTVRGRIDRIDRTDNGLVLIDYKTGKNRPIGIKDSNGKACIDLQLPLYQEAAAPDLFPDDPVASAYYYSIRGRSQINLSSKAPQHELPDAINRCKALLEQGHYPVQPDNKKEACKYCDFDALCRKGDRLNRKENNNGTD
jgi:CRISPR/Cas system-associated exonuclease Cas4 (RecB family)